MMFYFLLYPLLSFNGILIAAAVIPALILLYHVYRADHLEKESRSMLWTLVKAGVLSSLMALLSERIFSSLLGNLFSSSSTAYKILLFFCVVGISEEGAKFFQLKKNTWNSMEFNCLFDGVVYAVFVSLGFALWENISYVMHYGFATAVIRAVTAIPGHACFGVFMGTFYAAAKMFENYGDLQKAKQYEALSLIVPVLIHGTYDYIATMQTGNQNYLFIAFIAVLFFVTYRLVNEVARHDRYIN